MREAPPALAAAVAHAAQLGCAALRRLQQLRQHVQLSALVVAYRDNELRACGAADEDERALGRAARQSRAFGRAGARASRAAGLEPLERASLGRLLLPLPAMGRPALSGSVLELLAAHHEGRKARCSKHPSSSSSTTNPQSSSTALLPSSSLPAAP